MAIVSQLVLLKCSKVLNGKSVLDLCVAASNKSSKRTLYACMIYTHDKFIAEGLIVFDIYGNDEVPCNRKC